MVAKDIKLFIIKFYKIMNTQFIISAIIVAVISVTFFSIILFSAAAFGIINYAAYFVGQISGFIQGLCS